MLLRRVVLQELDPSGNGSSSSGGALYAQTGQLGRYSRPQATTVPRGDVCTLIAEEDEGTSLEFSWSFFLSFHFYLFSLMFYIFFPSARLPVCFLRRATHLWELPWNM
jgi:hypothetical protein